MFSKIMSDLYERVILSYKLTLAGIGILAADVVVQNLAGSSNTYVHAVAGFLALVLTFAKQSVQVPAPA
jgi:hypothetical protein